MNGTKPSAKLKPGTIVPSAEEDAANRAAIQSDPDAFELDADWFAKARPAAEVQPQVVQRHQRVRGSRRRRAKERVTIRLDADIAAHFRATGRGWQTRLNDALRDAVARAAVPPK